MEITQKQIKDEFQNNNKEDNTVKLSNEVLQQAQLQGFSGRKYLRPKNLLVRKEISKFICEYKRSGTLAIIG